MLRTALRFRALHAQLRVAPRGAGAARLGAARCGEAASARWSRPLHASPVLCVGKHRKKGDLPSKVCVYCNRPFNWCAPARSCVLLLCARREAPVEAHAVLRRRKKWEACWDEVKFCSAACRASAKKGERKPTDEAGEAPV